jgi:hypothetical protein
MSARGKGPDGYTLLQTLVVLGVLGLFVAALASPFTHWANRYRFETFMDQVASLSVLARSAAVTSAAPAVVEVAIDGSRVRVFLDRHGVGGPGTSADGIFNPVEGLPATVTDRHLAEVPIPAGIEPGAPRGEKPVEGLTLLARRHVLLLQPDGSAADSGAFRFGDSWGNYVEMRVAPSATARTQLRKYHKHWSRSADGSHWYSRDDGRPWEWIWGVPKGGGSRGR